jgi:CRP-like cAMP-binding protein
MNTAYLEHFLKNIDPLEHLTAEEKKNLASIIISKQYNKGDVVFEEGDESNTVYIVENGHLDLFIQGEHFKVFEKNDLFGEISFIDNNIRTGTVIAKEKSNLFVIHEKDILNANKINPALALKIYRKFASMVAGYLRSEMQTTTVALMEKGESEHVEFKSTLRYNLFSEKFDKNIEHAVLKTIAAFLNSEGGTLLVGVNDEGKAIGLENDAFKNDDKTSLFLINLIREHLGVHQMQFISIVVESINNIKILRIDVKACDVPCYLNHNNTEKFYVRTGASTSELPISEIYDFIRGRFIKI